MVKLTTSETLYVTNSSPYLSYWVHKLNLRNKDTYMKKLLPIITAFLLVLITSCTSDADVASHNLSKAADQFEISRRVVFYNGITNEYILVIEGLCSLGNYDASKQVTVMHNQFGMLTKFKN